MNRLEQAKRAAALCGLGGLLYQMASILLVNVPLPPLAAWQTLVVAMMKNALALAAPFLLLKLQPMQGEGLLLKRPRNATAVPLFLLFWVMVWAGTGAAWLLGQLLKAPSDTVVLQQGWLLILQWAALAIVPAVGEELLFRGLLQGYLRPYGSWAAVLGQAVIFALLHGNAQNCLAALFGGIALGICAECSGSIFVGMAFHLYNNTAAFVWQYHRQFGTAQPLAAFLDYLFPAAVLVWYLVWRRQKKSVRLQLPPWTGAAELTASPGWAVSVLLLAVFMILQTMT